MTSATTTVVRYRVKPDRAEENQALVEAVFAELAETRPDGLRYGTILLDDGVTFVHVAQIEGDNALSASPAFKAFSQNIAERCDEPPEPRGGVVIGNYGLYQ